MKSKLKEQIFKGSKSFSLASLFFNPATKIATWQLYAWCRYCDDLIDNAEKNQAGENFNYLWEQTHLAFSQVSQSEFPWSEFQDLVSRYRIPQKYAFDLLRGMKWDSEGASIESTEQLLDYCYCVAGSVGVMMCHIMGVNRPEALKHAVDLGIAFQLTNISRDIAEDFERGRIYIPQAWLAKAGIKPQELMEPHNFAVLKLWINHLLELAEIHYHSGWQGFSALPLRASIAVAMAALIYRQIGIKVRKKFPQALYIRTIVSLPQKLGLCGVAIVKLMPIIFFRFKKSYQPISKIPDLIWQANERLQELPERFQ